MRNINSFWSRFALLYLYSKMHPFGKYSVFLIGLYLPIYLLQFILAVIVKGIEQNIFNRGWSIEREPLWLGTVSVTSS